jgi:hypothetical protein
MRRHLVAFIALAGLLAVPAAASAKEISKVAVCGKAHHCKTYDTSDFKSLMFFAESAGPTDPPAAAAPWYRLRLTMDTGAEGGGLDSWTVAYVPSADSIRARDECGGPAWMALGPHTARILKRAVRALPAFAATHLRGLHPKPPEAIVDEVYTPARASKAVDSATTSWAWIAGASLAAALLLAAGVWTLRRRRGIEVAPT